MIRKSTVLVLAAAGALMLAVAAGCGGSSKSSASSEAATTEVATTEAATTEAATTEAPATTEAATTEAPATTAAPATTEAKPTIPSFASTANCQELAGLGQKLATALGGTGTDTAKVAAFFKQYADKAPAEIKSAFQTYAKAFGLIADALKGVNLKPGSVPDPAALAKLQKLGTEINQTALAKAGTDIAAWATKNCHA